MIKFYFFFSFIWIQWITVLNASENSDKIPVLPKYIKSSLSTYQSDIQTIARKAFPATYGNCQEDNPPSPCNENGYIYEDNSKWHKVVARWITGLNDLTIDSLSFSSNSDNFDMYFEFSITFQNLSMSIRAEVCAPFLGCTKLFDNTNSCCGNNRRLKMRIKATCYESKPFFRRPTIEYVEISPKLEVKPSLFGKIKIKVADITGKVENAIQNEGKKLVEEEAFKYLNSILENAIGDKVYCSENSKPTPEPTSKPTPEPTEAPTTEPTPQTEEPTPEPAKKTTEKPTQDTSTKPQVNNKNKKGNDGNDLDDDASVSLRSFTLTQICLYVFIIITFGWNF